MMPPCCVHSFVEKGFRENFRLATAGQTHRCETCGRHYILDPTWREIGTWDFYIAPLQIDEEDDKL